jgi:tetratricopeptide (TPR) repeat protein
MTTLGREFYQSGEYDPAVEKLEQSLEIRQKLISAHPELRVYRLLQARTFNQLGELYVIGLKKLQAGEAAHKNAIGLCEQLRKESPEEPEFMSELAATFTNFMHLANFTKEFKKAIEDGERAVPLLEQLIEKHEHVESYRLRLATVLSNIAMGHSNARQPDLAIDACARALPIAEGLHKNHPVVRDYTDRVAFIRNTRANALAQRGDFLRAAVDLELAEADAIAGVTVYNTACGYCSCALAVRRDFKVAKVEQDNLEGKYFERAMILLRKAKDTTPFFKTAQGLSLLRGDADLNPLRTRQSFAMFKAEVEEEARMPTR